MTDVTAWTMALDTALSRAAVLPSPACAGDVARLLEDTPALTPEWQRVADAARRWLGKVQVPPFAAIPVLEAALCRPAPPAARPQAPTSRPELDLSSPFLNRPAWQNRADCGDGAL